MGGDTSLFTHRKSSDYEGKLKLIMEEEFLFGEIENCESAPSEEMDKTGLCAAILYLRLDGVVT